MECFPTFVTLEVATIYVLCLFQARHPTNGELPTRTLRLVHIVYRHGDRSAMRGYPLDPIKEYNWSQGYGQLTKLGMDQEYRLGQSVRDLYIKKLDFLSTYYNRSKVLVRSTDTDRTLMSAYCVLAGLYPSQNITQAWNNTWQPIPVHTLPLNQDYLLSSHATCPLLEYLHQEFISKNQQLKDLIKQKQWLIQHVATHTGLPPTIDGLFEVQDPLFCENQHNMINTTSGWLAVNRTFLDIMALRDLPNSLLYPTPQMARLRSGVLLSEIVSNMKAKIRKSLDRDLVLYSAHDDTIVGLLSALKYFRYPDFPAVQPQYSTSIAIELHENGPSNFVVNVYLRNETNSPNLQLYPVPIQGCKDSCSFSNFTSLLSDMMVTDIKTECQLEKPRSRKSQTPGDSFMGVAILGALTGLFLVILVGAYWIYCKQKNNTTYQLIPLTEEP
ncbi:prostatic acid phosphatase-like isoform X2 [Saccostrea echinata]|uniref:prostatic acid phosphatase-like isoform X2 n=1 Tax=Saccostrea echinata TaxID=191078 RepID=UPI002A83D09A|nr:prostatic acid phosphatase-like isoform X2 [Saccostrea echinata]